MASNRMCRTYGAKIVFAGVPSAHPSTLLRAGALGKRLSRLWRLGGGGGEALGGRGEFEMDGLQRAVFGGGEIADHYDAEI